MTFFMDQNRDISIAGLLMAAGGVVLFSTKAIMAKLAYQYEVDHLSILLLRMVFSLPIYLVIGFTYKPKTHVAPLSKRDITGVVIAGVIGYYLASLYDFKGLQYISASLERLILFTYPTLVILIARFVLSQSITKNQYLGLIITYTGMIIIFGNEIFLGQNSNYWKGVGLVFLSALTYATYLTFSGKYIPRFGTVRFTSIALSVSAFCVIFHYWIIHGLSVLNFPLEVYLLGAAMAIFATVIPSFLISEAISRIGAPNMSIIGSLGPVSTILMAYWILGESLTVNQFIGAAVVILGIIWVNRRKKTGK